MGLTLSINQSDIQNTQNKISQISNEECINYCTNDSNIKINISGSEGGNIDIGGACFIDSPSCILKSSLDGDLINTLSNKQSGNITDAGGIFSALDALARIGGGDNINQNNYQNITNEITQQMNSLCNTFETVGGDITLNIDGSKFRNLTVGKTGKISKSQCVIDNMSKFYVQNNETNEQKAKITRMGMGLIILAIILIIIIIMFSHHHKSHSDIILKK